MWSKVLRTREEPVAHAALEQLCAIYWAPVVGYIRALGCGFDEAEDIAQEFFATFLRRDGFQRADQKRGSLRSYLKTAIRHEVMHWRRQRTAQRRGGGTETIPLDADDGSGWAANDLPAVHYDEQWALTVLERALGTMRESYAKRGKAELFERLKPTLMQPAPEESRTISAELGIVRGALAVEQHRARRRLADLLRAEVAQTVEDPADAEAELRHLLRVLAQTDLSGS